jgi:hypothetical protein
MLDRTFACLQQEENPRIDVCRDIVPTKSAWCQGKSDASTTLQTIESMILSIMMTRIRNTSRRITAITQHDADDSDQDEKMG